MSVKRNSSVELLKLIACAVIIFSHSFPRGIPTDAMPHLIDPSQATANGQIFWLIVIKYLGQVGNAVFIVSSTFFLRRSYTVKTRKVFDMIQNSFLISVLFLTVLLLTGWRFPLTTIIKQFIPITMAVNWFVGCYILFYLIHPALNRVIDSLDQRALLNICLLVLVFYCGINFLIPGRYYYTQLIGFINIHLLVSYMEQYMPKFTASAKQNLRLLLCMSAALFGLIWLTNFLGLRISALSGMADWFSNISNPLIIAIGICSFNLARMIQYENRTINYLSSLTLLIYIIHANDLIMDYVKPAFFAWVYQIGAYDQILLWCFLFGLILLIGGIGLSIVYQAIVCKLLKQVSDHIFIGMSSLWNRLLTFLISRS